MSEPVQVVRRRQSPSLQQAGDWSDLDMTLAHAMGLRCLRNGVRTTDLAEWLAAYRERIVQRLERVEDLAGLEVAMADIRNGRLAP